MSRITRALRTMADLLAVAAVAALVGAALLADRRTWLPAGGRRG